MGGSGFVQPYASARATVLTGIARLDDNRDKDDNLTQTQAIGFAPGGVAAVGVSGVVPFAGINARVDWELGYAHSLAMNLGDMGSLGFSGIHSRFGLGVRF